MRHVYAHRQRFVKRMLCGDFDIVFHYFLFQLSLDLLGGDGTFEFGIISGSGRRFGRALASPVRRRVGALDAVAAARGVTFYGALPAATEKSLDLRLGFGDVLLRDACLVRLEPSFLRLQVGYHTRDVCRRGGRRDGE